MPAAHLTVDDVIALAAERGAASGLAGYVVTQGTDTIDEVAFALDVLWDPPEPVVVTGAMRNPTATVTATARPMLDWLVGEGRRELALLLPELTDADAGAGAGAVPPSGASSGQDLLFVRVLELFERLAREQPVVLVIEDLHWADRSTRVLLVFLARNLRGAAVMLAGSYRTERLRRGDPLRSFLLELGHSGMVERIELARFDRVDVEALLEGVLGVSPAAAVVDDILARSDGNAFFAEELLVAMRRGGVGVLPPTLRDLLLDRVEVLSDVGRDGLARAAVAGRSVDHRLLAGVAGRRGVPARGCR